MKYIETLREGERVGDIYLCKFKQSAELKHCILAHHGELEYGSAKKPALPEAMALYFADNADAKMETFKEALNASGGSSEWLGYNRFFETNIRKSGF